MCKTNLFRIAFLSMVCLAVSAIAGSPFAGLGLIVAQVITPPIVGVLVGCLLLAVFLLEGRNATLPLTLVASRAFIVGLWFMTLAMLWLVTLAVTPQAYGDVVAAFNLALGVGTLACRQWKAGRFWPSQTDGRLARLTANLKDVFARVDRLSGLKPKVDVAGVAGVQDAFRSAANDVGRAS